jgi:hypothetical protein
MEALFVSELHAILEIVLYHGLSFRKWGVA